MFKQIIFVFKHIPLALKQFHLTLMQFIWSSNASSLVFRILTLLVLLSNILTLFSNTFHLIFKHFFSNYLTLFPNILLILKHTSHCSQNISPYSQKTSFKIPLLGPKYPPYSQTHLTLFKDIAFILLSPCFQLFLYNLILFSSISHYSQNTYLQTNSPKYLHS